MNHYFLSNFEHKTIDINCIKTQNIKITLQLIFFIIMPKKFKANSKTKPQLQKSLVENNTNSTNITESKVQTKVEISQAQQELSDTIVSNNIEDKVLSKKSNKESEATKVDKMNAWNTVAKVIAGIVILTGIYDFVTKDYQNGFLSLVVAVLIWPNLLEWNFSKANKFQKAFLIIFAFSYLVILYRLFVK